MHARICAAVYVAVTVALTWPLVLVLATHVPRDLGDPLLSIWALWWNGQHVPFTAAWWDAPQFHPVHGSAAFSDHRVGLVPIAQPVQWAGGSPLLAYNLALILSFPLSAAAAHLLVYSLTRRPDAALVAGLAFGFNPYRIAHLEHLELVSSYWMPVALFALHRFVDERKLRWACLFGGAWLLQSLCSSYYLFYFSVLVALWLVWFGRGLRLRGAAMLAACWTIAAVLLLPLLLKYAGVHESLDLKRTRDEIMFFSADIAAVFSASPLLAFWRPWALVDRAEGQLFPGSVALALIAAAMLLAARQRTSGAPALVRLLPIVAAALGALAITPAVFGPWRFAFAGVSISVSGYRKPLSVAAGCLILYFVMHPRVRAAFRAKSPFAFYVVAAVALWILSWGPEPRFLGHTVLYEAPYAWLMRLPGFESGLRVPARFAMPAVLALSAAAGLAFARIVPLERGALRAASVVIVSLGVIADGWIRDLPLLSPPPSWTAPVEASAFAAVLELPVTHGGLPDAAAVYRSISHRHPTVNGFSGHFPPHYMAMRLGLERGEQEVLSALSASGPILVAVDGGNDPDGGWRRYVAQHEGATVAGAHDRWTFFLVPRTASPNPPVPAGALVPVAGISASFSRDPSAWLLDGNPTTRWVTPSPQRGNEQVLVDAGTAHKLRSVVVSLGVFREDFPRGLAIETSVDGQQWATAWKGRTAGLAVAAALHDPHHTNMVFPVAAVARFVRLRLTEADPTYYWSIADLVLIRDDR